MGARWPEQYRYGRCRQFRGNECIRAKPSRELMLMMRFLAALLLSVFCGHASACVTTTGAGKCGNSGPHPIGTPAVVPQASSFFKNGTTSNYVLKPNHGTVGAFEFPPTITNSHFLYVEGQIPSSPSLQWALGSAVGPGGLELSALESLGVPSFFFQNRSGTQTNEIWWEAISAVNTPLLTSISAFAGSGYNTSGYYPATATGGGCQRPPSFIWVNSSPAPTTDPGFLCSGTVAPTAVVANIPGAGGRQNTGVSASPPQAASTCAPNSPVSGSVTITTPLAIAHGIQAGQTYSLGSFPAPFSTTYTATLGTTSTKLVGTAAINSGACTGFTGEGTALSGISATVTFPVVGSATPWNLGSTGITTKQGQHFCGIIGEYGDDSPFPGAQFASFVDRDGTPLQGAPALVPWLNQGTANVTGFITAGTQSSSFQYVTVSALSPYTITAATYSPGSGITPAEVTFTTSTSPGFIPGSEFTVTGVTPSGYNHTYVAVAGTSGTTIVGNPLSGPVGTPQFLSNPGSFVSGGTMVSVIMPDMQVNGFNAGSVIAPYGTFGGTGSGGVGTYAFTANAVPFTFTGHIDNGSGGSGNILTAPANFVVIGSNVTGAGVTAGTVVDGLLTATTFHVNNAQLVPSETLTNTGNVGSSGAPVNLFAYPLFYQSGANSLTSPGFVTTPRTRTALSDFINIIGGATTFVGKAVSGWNDSLANVGMFYGVFPPDSSGAPDTTQLASICKKQQDPQTFAQAQTVAGNPITVNSLYRLNDLGIWGDSSDATIVGYVTNTSGTNATLNVVSTMFGSLALATGTQTATLTGPGLPTPASSPTIPLTTSASSTYALTPNPTAAVASVGSPVTFNVGQFQPAAPLQSNLVNGFISGNTLTVTSVQSAATSTFTGQLNTGFTATIDNGSGSAGNILTVTAPLAALNAGNGSVIGVGTTISGAGVTSATVLNQINPTGATGGVFGFAGHYTIDGSPQLVTPAEAMLGGGPIPGLRDTANRIWRYGAGAANDRRPDHYGRRRQHQFDFPAFAPERFGGELGRKHELLSGACAGDDVRDADERGSRNVCHWAWD